MDRLRFNEASTGAIEFDIVDEAGIGVPTADLTAAQLTLYDVDTAAPAPDGSPAQGVINGRSVQDILNTNDVTIVDVGSPGAAHVTWQVQPADNIIVTARRQVERHRAMFRFTWSGGAFDYEIELEVVNLRKAG